MKKENRKFYRHNTNVIKYEASKNILKVITNSFLQDA